MLTRRDSGISIANLPPIFHNFFVSDNPLKMLTFLKSAALLLPLGLAFAQEAMLGELLAEPTVLWTNTILPRDSGAETGVSYGNGVKLTPDGKYLIATSEGGTVSAFDAFSGDFAWDYDPPQPEAGGATTSHSQVVFTTPNAVTEPYMVYSIIERELSLDAATKVIALSMAGDPLWISEPLNGVAKGSPVISDDGNFIFLTHNAELNTVGYFSSLWAPGDGAVYYSQKNDTTPFAPLGIFHSPVEGNYDGDEGRGNTNDMIMWAQSPHPEDDTIMPGHTFGFQFPIGFDPVETLNVSYFLLGPNARDFRADTAPTMTNQGLSGYFGASRSSFWGWFGSAENGRGRFNRGPNAGSQGFPRNPNFAGQSVFASPAVTSSDEEPVIFGGAASAVFVRLNFDFTERAEFPTSSFIKAEARVDPVDRVVYCAEEAGFVHQFPVEGNFAPTWSFGVEGGVPIEGDMALNKNGWILYVADTSGFITALQVSTIPETEAPSASPTAMATMAPTMAPVDATPEPTPAPIVPATPEPTAAPVSDPTPAPATPEPTRAPSSAAQPIMILSVVSMVLSLFL